LPPVAEKAGVIEIEFATGGRMRITGPVDVLTVAALMKALAKGKAAAMIPVPSGAHITASAAKFRCSRPAWREDPRYTPLRMDHRTESVLILRPFRSELQSLFWDIGRPCRFHS
jgi:hypothetical protein